MNRKRDAYGSPDYRCHRMPPIYTGIVEFPMVEPNWWCGEYQDGVSFQQEPRRR